MSEPSRQDEADTQEIAPPAAEGGSPSDVFLRKIAKNAGVTAAGNVITQLFAPITGIITTRALGVEMYGIYSLCVSWTGIVADLSRLGFGGDTLVRFLGRYTGEQRLDKAKGALQLTAKITVGISALCTLALMIFAEPFAIQVLNTPHAAQALRFFAPAVFLTATYGAVIAALTGFQAQRYVVLANSIWGNVANLVSLILFVMLGMDLYAALASSLVQDVVILGLGLFFLIKVFPGLRDRALAPVTETKELWTFSGTMLATSLFSKYTFKLDVLFLGLYASASDVGVYAVALRLQPLIYMPHYAIAQIFAPMVAELYARRETAELQSIYQSVTKWTASFSLPIFATLAFFHEPILAVFGKDFTGAAMPLIILGVGNSAADMFGLSGHVITMIGRPNINLINSLATTGISVGLFLLLIPPYGAVGAAVAYGSSLVIINILRVLEVYRFLGIHPFRASLLKVFGALAAASAAIYGLRMVPTLAEITWLWVPEMLLFWVIYAGATWALGLDAADRMVVDAIVRKVRKKSNRKR